MTNITRVRAIISPPPSRKACPQALQSFSQCHQYILILIFYRLSIVFIILRSYLFVKVFQRLQLVGVLVVEFLQLIRVPYKVLGRIPSRVRVIAFLVHLVIQRPLYKLTYKDFLNFPFVVAINLYQQQQLILLSKEQVI